MKPLRVSGVVLAAGPSKRFGVDPPKQLALVDGEPMVCRVVRQALGSQLSEVIVVVGMAAARVEGALQGLEVQIARNPDYEDGQSTSVRVGLQAVVDSASAAMFIPGDQARLSTAVIDALIDLYRQTGAPIVVPVHGGERGAPVVIDRELFGELVTIEGDAGGRQIFPAHEESIAELSLSSSAPLDDVDFPGDLPRRDD